MVDALADRSTDSKGQSMTSQHPLAVDTSDPELKRASLVPVQGNGESTLTELVSGIANDAQHLIQQQYQMLRAELREDLQRTKAAVKCLGIGAAGSVVGMLFLAVAAPLFLNWLFAMPPWAGWAIVGGALFVGGVIALFVGKTKFDKFNPLPDKTLHAFEENISWMVGHED
jgi:hypothetical protein